MYRIRCLPAHQEQALLFCQNNDIRFKNEGLDLSIISFTDACDLSAFLLRLESLDRMDQIQAELSNETLSLNEQ